MGFVNVVVLTILFVGALADPVPSPYLKLDYNGPQGQTSLVTADENRGVITDAVAPSASLLKLPTEACHTDCSSSLTIPTWTSHDSPSAIAVPSHSNVGLAYHTEPVRITAPEYSLQTRPEFTVQAAPEFSVQAAPEYSVQAAPTPFSGPSYSNHGNRVDVTYHTEPIEISRPEYSVHAKPAYFTMPSIPVTHTEPIKIAMPEYTVHEEPAPIALPTVPLTHKEPVQIAYPEYNVHVESAPIAMPTLPLTHKEPVQIAYPEYNVHEESGSIAMPSLPATPSKFVTVSKYPLFSKIYKLAAGKLPAPGFVRPFNYLNGLTTYTYGYPNYGTTYPLKHQTYNFAYPYHKPDYIDC